MDVLVFGGTSEGRRLVEWLSERNSCGIVYCAATEYGSSLVAGNKNVAVVDGPLSSAQKDDLVAAHDFCCVVDATHPYATHISASIDELAICAGIDVVRIARDDEGERFVGSCTSARGMEEAARLVASKPGNVLLTTGTNDLASFTRFIPDAAERLYVRVLPVARSLELVREAGIPTSHVIAMQGPFSAELNVALMREFDVRTLVTKRSGRAGGFEQKVQAARECGASLLVVERPVAREGVSFEDAKGLLEERYGL